MHIKQMEENNLDYCLKLFFYNVEMVFTQVLMLEVPLVSPLE